MAEIAAKFDTLSVAERARSLQWLQAKYAAEDKTASQESPAGQLVYDFSGANQKQQVLLLAGTLAAQGRQQFSTRELSKLAAELGVEIGNIAKYVRDWSTNEQPALQELAGKSGQKQLLLTAWGQAELQRWGVRAGSEPTGRSK